MKHAMDKFLSSHVQHGPAGCGCAVAQNGEKLYEGYFGYADLEKKIPITYSDTGNARGNVIEGFSLAKGTTTIKILFADNMAHTVIKKMYYEEK